MLLRWLIGYPLSLAIMPSQFTPEYNPIYDIDYAELRKTRHHNGISITNRKVGSTNKANIDFSELTVVTSKKPTPIKEQKIIIHAQGNGDFYENHMDEYANLARKYPDYRIIGFNFRGTMASKGRAWSENDWVEDATSVVNYYRKKGISTENILLSGHSMGGALLTLAAARIYQRDLALAEKNKVNKSKIESVRLINNRSFANLTDEFIISILGSKGSAVIAGLFYGSLFSISLGAIAITITIGALLTLSLFTDKLSYLLLKPWVKGALWLGFGTMEVADAYKSLPQHSVDHIVAKHDSMIKDKAGLHNALRPQTRVTKSKLREDLNNPCLKKAALEKLISIKDSKIRYNDDPKEGFLAHMAPLFCLTTYHKLRNQKTTDKKPRQISGEEVLTTKIDRLFNIK